VFRHSVVAALGIALVVALGGPVQAEPVSELNYEGQAGSSNGKLQKCASPNDEFSCGPGDFAAIVAANELKLDPTGNTQIDPIGKFDFGSGSGSIELPFSPNDDGTSPFSGATGTVQSGFFTINGDLLEGLLFTIVPDEPMDTAWSIVKILIKQSNDNDGNFLAFGLNSVISEPSTTLLQAFIPKSEYAEFPANNTQNLALSHWTAFGVRSVADQVPEPVTLLFLGLGLVGVGIAGRRVRA
jgi:hypothetical protein